MATVDRSEQLCKHVDNQMKVSLRETQNVALFAGRKSANLRKTVNNYDKIENFMHGESKNKIDQGKRNENFYGVYRASNLQWKPKSKCNNKIRTEKGNQGECYNVETFTYEQKCDINTQKVQSFIMTHFWAADNYNDPNYDNQTNISREHCSIRNFGKIEVHQNVG